MFPRSYKRKGEAAHLTSQPIEPGDIGSILPEFGRIADVERMFGVKRGILYRLIQAKKIKSCCIRKPGAKTGVRLVHLASVRELLTSNLE